MKRKITVGLLALLMLIIISCGPGEKKSSKSGNAGVGSSNFPIETTNNEKAVEGGTLKVAIVKDSPLAGIFSMVLYQDAFDGQVIDTFMRDQIFDVDENFEITDTGAATLSVNAENKSVTIKIKDGVKWSDGQPLTADDVIYAYEIIGSPDYTGVRYNDERAKIVGMEEYHKGNAKTISGIKKIDDKTVEISFIELGQGIYTIGNGLYSSAVPKHYIGDVPIKDLVSSEKVRTKIVTLGAYIPVKMTQGESIEFKANENHFKGKPKIERATLQVVNSQTIVAAIKSGEYDVVLSMPGNLYNTFKDLDNIEILGREELYYSYIGFKVGKFDNSKGEVAYNPESKMADIKLRQALAYGINVDEMTQAFFHGLRVRANTTVPPIFAKYHASEVKGYPYDPEKSKQLLEEAGYKDVNGDGYREDKNGKPFEVRLAAMAGGDIAEPLGQFYIQQWKEIGIKAVFATGRLIEFNAFYDKVKADDPEIDVFFAAWGTGTNPDPSVFAGRKSRFNYPRFASEENDKLLADVGNPISLTDLNYKAEAYKKWQEYYVNQAVEVPLTFRYEIFPVNKRVKNYYVGYDEFKVGKSIHNLELTAAEPIKSSK